MNISDVFFSNSDAGDVNMDFSMNYDNAELMSSEFFDSVLSLENDLEDGFLSNFEDDNNLSSDASHSDEVLSPRSFYSESDKNSTSSLEASDTFTETEPASILENIDGLDDPVLLSFLDTITLPKESKNVSVINTPSPVVLQSPSSTPRTTKMLIQNPSNKKCIAKPMATATQLRKPNTKVKPQILKVQQITNGRQVLLPLNLKSIKIVNGSEASLLTNAAKRKFDAHPIREEESEKPITNHQYPALVLNNEEKRLLSKEGIQLPSHYPLTKNEEKELKRIRRKIRNKISAQDSRKRKKEYVDGLEDRVKRGSEENKNLLQRVRELQRQNRTLIAHVNRLQALICKSSTSKATPSTCLMVVLLSALLVSLPNMRLLENKQMVNDGEQVSIRRSLLSDVQATEDDLNMEEFLIFKDDESEMDVNYGDDVDNSTGKELSKILDSMGKKFGDNKADKNNLDKLGLLTKIMETMRSFITDKNSKLLEMKSPNFGGTYNKNGFIEPDIDDYIPGDEGPPLKRIRFDIDEYEVTSTNVGSETFVSSTINNHIIKDK
ncbi:CREB-H transcription factor homolog let-607-like isoform X2 [Euwallacea similis]|uniref:CREB-H transcription factor homolog let-607-like isoform X2 n=1 Tax=Euwallacea similis TaxID=1736056 RepID=UPI0034500B37